MNFDWYLFRTGGNSWSTGPAPPPPPGAGPIHLHPKKESGKSSTINGVAIATILVSVLVALAILVALLSRRRSSSPPSHFLDEEKASQRKGYTPFSSQQLSWRSETFKGSFLSTFILFSSLHCIYTS